MPKSELGDYLTSIGRYPVLSKEAQLLHAQRIRSWVHYPGGREAAPRNIQRAGSRSMELMVATNLRLVVSIAKRYSNKGIEQSDLVQEGNLGLIRGLELFDPSRGYQFSTYAYWWIRQAITRAIYTKSKLIRIPVNTQELMGKIFKFTNSFRQEHGRVPTHLEIAAALDITPNRVRIVLDQTTSVVYSLDAPSTCTVDDPSSLVDLVTDEDQEDPTETIQRRTQKDLLVRSMDSLNPTETHVIEGLYSRNLSIRELSTELGKSGSRVGQIRSAALNTMRAELQNLNVLTA